MITLNTNLYNTRKLLKSRMCYSDVQYLEASPEFLEFRSDLIEWLESRPFKAYSVSHKSESAVFLYQYSVEIEFDNDNDLLLFKLTWC